MRSGEILKRILSVVTAFVLTAGLTGMSLVSAADETDAADSAAVYSGKFDIYEDSVFAHNPEFETGYSTKTYSERYESDIYVKCYQEYNTDHTSTLKAVNPNASLSEIREYADDQFSKGTMKKLTIALVAQTPDDGFMTDTSYNVIIQNSCELAEEYYPLAHMKSLADNLSGLVNFVPDGEYEFQELCRTADVIVYPYDYMEAQLFFSEYYGNELLALGWPYDYPIYYIYSEAPQIHGDFTGHTLYDMEADFTPAEAFALMYGNPCYTWGHLGSDYYLTDGNGKAVHERSCLCQLDTMETDGTVVISSKVCYGHDFELASAYIDNEFRGFMNLECKYCGLKDTKTADMNKIGETPATCTEDGNRTYRMSCTHTWDIINGGTGSQSFMDVRTTDVPALGHDYLEHSVTDGLQPVVISNGTDGMRQTVVDAALDHVGDKYVIGGRGYEMWSQGANNTGTWPVFDCSGLTQYIYLNALKDGYGISVAFADDDSRWAVDAQWNFRYGYAIDITDNMTYSDFIGRLKPGDLVFFNEQSDGTPGHVGIYIGNGQMVNANSDAGEVVIENLTNRSWSSFIGARRIILEVGEMYPASMELYCSRGDSEITVDAVSEITMGNSATCGHSGSYEIHSTAYWDNEMYETWTEAAAVPSTTSHEWDYDNVKYEYVDPRVGTYAVLTCKLCGKTRTEHCDTSYTVRQLNYDPETSEYEDVCVVLSASFTGEDGSKYIYNLDVSDRYNEIEELHTWVPVEETETEPTCTEDGFCEYICADEDCDAVQTVIRGATGHDCTAVFTWNDDYSECTADYICTVCGEITDSAEAETGSVSDENGTTYTAFVLFDGTVYTDEIYVVNETEDGDDDNADKEDAGGNTDNDNNGSGSDSGYNTDDPSDDTGDGGGSGESGADESKTDSDGVTGSSADSGSTSENVSAVSAGTSETVDDGGKEAEETGSVKTGDAYLYGIMAVECTAIIGIGAVLIRRKRTV